MAKTGLALCLAVFVVCQSAQVMAKTAADPHPALVIASPQDGSITLGTRVTIDVTVGEVVLTDFKRVPENRPGQGHLHFWLDQANPTTSNAIHYFRNQLYTFTNVAPGNHTLIVEVVSNNHSSFESHVIKKVQFATSLPKDVKQPPLVTSVSQLSSLQYMFSQHLISILVGLILINSAVLLWFWSGREG